MAVYVSLPREVEAFQWTEKQGAIKDTVYYHATRNRYYVVTIHNQCVYIESEDYIVSEPNGIHYYPVKASIFEKSYKLKEEIKKDG